MAGWIPQRLRQLLGADLDAVDRAALLRLVGVPEDIDLDFKAELHGTSDGQAKEAAYDVAQFANAGGGLLILGVAEDGTGCAAAVKGVQAPDHDYGLWIHQVSSTRISPAPLVVHRGIDLGALEVHLVSVPPSVAAPHLVAVGGDGYRAPIRSGTTRRWLREAELADRYRRRFSDLRQREVLTETLQERGTGYTTGNQSAWSWLILTLVPDTPGELELRQGMQQSWLRWLRKALREFPGDAVRDLQDVRLGFRCLSLTDSYDPRQPPYALGAELYLDGSGVVAFAHASGQAVLGSDSKFSYIDDEDLLANLINGFAVLGEHASRSGAAGSATLSASLRNASLPMMVAQHRTTRKPPGPLSGAHPVKDQTGTSRHTLPIDALITEEPERLLAPRLIAADLLSAFGLAESQQITTDLELALDGFTRSRATAVVQWAEQHNILVITQSNPNE